MGFQFKKELADRILAGKKTQTRRPVKESDSFRFDGGAYPEVHRNGRLLWYKPGIYAIQPGRGKPRVGHLQIKDIKIEDVRNISLEDAIAEGFESQLGFLATWIAFYDKGIWLDRIDIPVRNMRVGDWYMHCTQRDHKWFQDSASEDFIWDVIKGRSAQLYQAYAITFVLHSAEAVQS